jgi:hypothetical protein
LRPPLPRSNALPSARGKAANIQPIFAIAISHEAPAGCVWAHRLRGKSGTLQTPPTTFRATVPFPRLITLSAIATSTAPRVWHLPYYYLSYCTPRCSNPFLAHASAATGCPVSMRNRVQPLIGRATARPALHAFDIPTADPTPFVQALARPPVPACLP